jgi:enolase
MDVAAAEFYTAEKMYDLDISTPPTFTLTPWPWPLDPEPWTLNPWPYPRYDLDFKTEGDAKDKSQTISSDQLTAIYEKFCQDYPVISIEDPFDQARSRR